MRAVALAVLLVFTPLAARAQDLPPADPDVPCEPTFDEDVQRRTAWIQARFDESETAAQIWWWSWIVIFGGATALQLTLALALQPGPDDAYLRNFRSGMITGTATATLATGSMFFTPIRAHSVPSALRAMPEDTAEERVLKLRAAERMLAETAAGAVQVRDWFQFVQAGLLATASSLVLHFGFDAAAQIPTQLATSVSIGTLRIFTAPDAAPYVWARYRQRYPGVERCMQASAPRRSDFAWTIGPTLGGLVLTGTF